jgi:hypothetical protein
MSGDHHPFDVGHIASQSQGGGHAELKSTRISRDEVVHSLLHALVVPVL